MILAEESCANVDTPVLGLWGGPTFTTIRYDKPSKKVAGGSGPVGCRDEKAYPTDPSDAEWARIEPFLLAPSASGRPRVHTLRGI
jgi:hypothetical protein